jgi:hypothetical protein
MIKRAIQSCENNSCAIYLKLYNRTNDLPSITTVMLHGSFIKENLFRSHLPVGSIRHFSFKLRHTLLHRDVLRRPILTGIRNVSRLFHAVTTTAMVQGGPRKSSPPPVCTCPCDILSLALVIFSLWHLGYSLWR